MEDRAKLSPFQFLDGAMGTELLAAGLPLGQRPEILCFTAPEVVADVHRRYLRAGSDVIYANTFGANAHKLAGTGYTVDYCRTVGKAVQIILL